MDDQDQSKLFKDNDSEKELIATVKRVGDTLAQVATMNDKARNLPLGQSKVIGSLSACDRLTSTEVYAVDNKKDPAVSDGVDHGPISGDADEQMSLLSTEFIMCLVVGNALFDPRNKEITAKIDISDGQTNPSYITTLKVGATLTDLKVEMTGPNGPLTDEQVKKAEDSFGQMLT